ncbi:MAG: VOC family protein [Chloroflexi bacterium]|nr:VOC family protein [Chloroflexota bacterium]
MVTSFQVTFDCADPQRMMEFWAPALGYTIPGPPDGHESWEAFLAAQGVPEDEWNSAGAVEDPTGTGPRIYFQRVPEEKAVKNRVHLDLNVGGGKKTPLEERRRRVDAEAVRLMGLGATVQRPGSEERGEYWIIMQDPEGNELCLQ